MTNANVTVADVIQAWHKLGEAYQLEWRTSWRRDADATDVAAVEAKVEEAKRGLLDLVRRCAQPIPVAEIFSGREGTIFAHEGIVYLDQLASKNEKELLRTPNVGRKTVNHIKSVLADFGYDVDDGTTPIGRRVE